MTREQKIELCCALGVEIPPLDAADFAAQLASQVYMARSRVEALEIAERAGQLSRRDRDRLREARRAMRLAP